MTEEQQAGSRVTLAGLRQRRDEASDYIETWEDSYCTGAESGLSEAIALIEEEHRRLREWVQERSAMMCRECAGFAWDNEHQQYETRDCATLCKREPDDLEAVIREFEG